MLAVTNTIENAIRGACGLIRLTIPKLEAKQAVNFSVCMYNYCTKCMKAALKILT